MKLRCTQQSGSLVRPSRRPIDQSYKETNPNRMPINTKPPCQPYRSLKSRQQCSPFVLVGAAHGDDHCSSALARQPQHPKTALLAPPSSIRSLQATSDDHMIMPRAVALQRKRWVINLVCRSYTHTPRLEHFWRSEAPRGVVLRCHQRGKLGTRPPGYYWGPADVP